MNNQEAYEEMCEKAEKYEKLKEAIRKIKTEIKNEEVRDDEGVLRSQVTHTWRVLEIINKHTGGLI